MPEAAKKRCFDSSVLLRCKVELQFTPQHTAKNHLATRPVLHHVDRMMATIQMCDSVADFPTSLGWLQALLKPVVLPAELQRQMGQDARDFSSQPAK
jgi:hypothetical protein